MHTVVQVFTKNCQLVAYDLRIYGTLKALSNF